MLKGGLVKLDGTTTLQAIGPDRRPALRSTARPFPLARWTA